MRLVVEGQTMVNLTADVPARARATADWAHRHGIGPEELHHRHRPVLQRLGGTHAYLGADIGRAAAYDVALLDVFWTAMTGYAHALALAGAEGITARQLAPFAAGIGAILPPIFEETPGHGRR